MVNKGLIAIVGIGVVGVVAMGLILLAKAKTKIYQLVIQHNEFGTTDPEIGTTPFDNPTQVTVHAYPNSGYQANWTVNGQDVATNVNSYSLYIDGYYAVSVTFIPIGGGEVGPITGVKPVGTIGLSQNFRFWYGSPFSPIDIGEADENWNFGRCKSGTLSFKVHDAADRGIPNIQVRIYPDLNNDTTAYKGWLGYYPNLPLWDITHPLILTTDNNGLVSVPIFNFYMADDISVDGGGIELSRGTNLGVGTTWLTPPWNSMSNVPIWHGWTPRIGVYISSNFGGGTIGPIGKIIRAEVVGTDKSTIQNILVSYSVIWKA